ncbi:MAG: hypothetical protein HYX47_06260 [Burkholderiales bacterium]|nr:hypothetical protein [Burkholderiales bacterium]
MGKLDLSKYGAVADLMRTRSAGYQAHATRLRDEIRAHDGSHAYGRHGYQIGWEGQLVRCATSIAPDQTFDPSGVGAVIRRWNSLNYKDRMLDHTGASVATDLIGPFNPELTDYKTVAGIMSGGFLGPEHQEEARTAALTCAAGLSGPNFAGIEMIFRGSPNVRMAMPFTSFCYGIHGRFFGMGYKRKTGFVAVSHEFVLACIEAFYNRTPLSTFEGSIPGTVAKPAYMTGPGKDKTVAFPQIGDLLEFLKVETFAQKAVRVVMRRPYSFTTQDFGPWRLVTMFPDDSITSTGFHPGRPFFAPEMKAKINAMKQKKFPPDNKKKYGHLNFDKNLYDWSGKTCDIAMAPSSFKIHPVPAWM